MASLSFLTSLVNILYPEGMTKYFWWLSIWELNPSNGQFRLISGLLYWITTPCLNAGGFNTLRCIIYSIFILVSGGIGSWVAIFDKDKLENPDKLADDLMFANGVTLDVSNGVKSKNESEEKLNGKSKHMSDSKGGEKSLEEGGSDEKLKEEIKRLVPMAAILGGFVLGCVCIVSDVFGVIGGAQGMLVATNIMYMHYEAWEKETERKKPSLRQQYLA
jgi:hypothetical protein